MKSQFDLLSTVEQGGCSAKFPAQLLDKILKDIPIIKKEQLLVGTDTHDDAAVWKVDDNTAIISTTDFFPPLCSDPYEFGEIAASNALSDVFAMGGIATMALNLVMFPSAKIDIGVLKDILQGGAEKVAEAGAVLAGGHTIDDDTPKYGLAVNGIVHPDKIITNCDAKEGDVLILAKPIGTGAIMAGNRIDEVSSTQLQAALDGMKLLNKNAAEVMRTYDIKCATDVTGFSLLGHTYEMALGSDMMIQLNAADVPLLDRAYDLIDMGCIPGASFRNLKYVDPYVKFSDTLDYNLKMLMVDAQTSGGILLSAPKEKADLIISDMKKSGYPSAAVIGTVTRKEANQPFVLIDA